MAGSHPCSAARRSIVSIVWFCWASYSCHCCCPPFTSRPATPFLLPWNSIGIILLPGLMRKHLITLMLMQVSNIIIRKTTMPMKKFKDQNSHILPNKKICPSNGSLFGKPCISLGLPLPSYASSGEVYYLPVSCRVVCAFMTDRAIPLSCRVVSILLSASCTGLSSV